MKGRLPAQAANAEAHIWFSVCALLEGLQRIPVSQQATAVFLLFFKLMPLLIQGLYEEWHEFVQQTSS